MNSLRQIKQISNIYPLKKQTLLNCRKYHVLALEYSCDDTCVAIIENTGKIIFNRKVTSPDVEKDGGVVPLTAIVHHQRHLSSLVQQALKETNLKLGNEIKMICATKGPGQAGCLSTGYQFAKGLALPFINEQDEKTDAKGESKTSLTDTEGLKFMGVHHMLGHLMTSSMEFPELLDQPFLSLLVSGGHTQLVLTKDILTHEIKLDLKERAAVGDSLDKCARFLGFKGNMIAKEMERYIQNAKLPLDDKEYHLNLTKHNFPFTYPIPGSHNGNMAFSFTSFISQLKDYIRKENIDMETITPKRLAELAYIVQYFHFYHIIKKIKLQFKICPEIKNLPIVISGGVSANSYLRKYMKKEFPTQKIYYPNRLDLCTDNAVMIGWAGLKMYEKTGKVTDLDSVSRHRWPLDELLD